MTEKTELEKEIDEPMNLMLKTETEINKSTNNKYVIWSGGYDSTLILYNLLEKNKETNNIITAVYFNIYDIEYLKKVAEKRAREKFIEFCKEKGFLFNFYEFNISFFQNNSSLYNTIQSNNKDGMKQQTLWITLASLYIPDNSDIYFGFHSGDVYWHYKHELENIKTVICKMTQKNINFIYPLEWTSKHIIVQNIINLKLENYVWTCEKPKEGLIPCGQCVPCENLLNSYKILGIKLNE